MVLSFFFLSQAWPACGSRRDPGARGWLALGDLRGHLETCGCDPRTDLGGVARIARLLAREIAEDPDILIFDLGNNFELPPVKNLTTTFLARALERLPLDVSLLNRSEILAAAWSRNDRPFILSNTDRSLNRLHPDAEPLLKKKGHIIFGYVWHRDLASRLKSWEREIPGWVIQARKREASLRSVLLFSGPHAHLEPIANSSLFDLIVTSNSKGDAALPGFDEQKDPSRLVIPLRHDMVARMVPLGGTGVLRGGYLRDKEAPDLDSIFAGAEAGRGVTSASLLPLPGKAPAFQPVIRDFPVTWLGPAWEGGSPLRGLMETYLEEARGQFQKLATARASALKDSPFAGADNCKSCHPSAWKAWRQSAHASALDTLKSQNKHEDPACVSCHVVGWQERGGYASEAASPQFAGVQCENCHGAAKEHSQMPAVKKPGGHPRPGGEVCIKCHHSPHSASFGFRAYWPKIRHGKEKP